MTNERKIKVLNAWQNNESVHPLTCGNDSSHSNLKAIEQDGEVILACQDCDYTQKHIPKCVLHLPPKMHTKRKKPKDEV